MDVRLTLLVAAAVSLSAGDASASRYLDPDRKGFQADLAAGASFCMPSGFTPCRTLAGATEPLVGAGFTAGWRPRAWLFVGGAYELASLRPTYNDILGSFGRRLYAPALQHAVFGVVRTGVDIGRLDLGLEFGLGYSRVSAAYAIDERRGQRYGSDGLALRFAPLIAVYLTRHVYIGLRFNATLNLHRRLRCSGACTDRSGDPPAFGHQGTLAFMVGATF
jgi:hypothetical protein